MALFKGNPLKYEGRGLIHNIDGCFVYNIKPCTSTRFLDKAYIIEIIIYFLVSK
jgi:hypothetical protein